MNKTLSLMILLIITFGILLNGISAQSETELPEPGILPDSPFYGFKRAFEAMGSIFVFGEQARLERHLKLAEKRLAEAEAIAEKEKPRYMERLTNRYEERIRKANEISENSGEENREQLMERVADATSKHLEVLDRVYDQVPEEAKEAIAAAREKSINGNQEALRALARENPEKSAEITMQIAEKRAERIRAVADEDDEEELERVSEEYEIYADFGEEISVIAEQIGEDPSKVQELVALATSRHLVILEQVLEKVPEEAKEAIQRAIESSIQGRNSAVGELEERGITIPDEVKESISRRADGRTIPGSDNSEEDSENEEE